MSTVKAFQQHNALYEEVVSAIIRTAPRGGVHVDGGAHVGQHTRAMLARQDVRRVYAVEAIPALCERIASGLGSDARLVLVRDAIGKQRGEAEFHVAVNATGYSGLLRRDLAAVTAWQSLAVRVRTLDEIVANADHGDVGLIKLDLEGGEFDALRGALALLSRARPLVVFENGLRNPASSYGYGWQEFDALFSAHGYTVWDYFGQRVDRAYWERPLYTYMFVATPDDESHRLWRTHVLSSIVQRAAATVNR